MSIFYIVIHVETFSYETWSRKSLLELTHLVISLIIDLKKRRCTKQYYKKWTPQIRLDIIPVFSFRKNDCSLHSGHFDFFLFFLFFPFLYTP